MVSSINKMNKKKLIEFGKKSQIKLIGQTMTMARFQSLVKRKPSAEMIGQNTWYR